MAECGTIRISNGENAFFFYRQAVAKMQPASTTTQKEMGLALDGGWGVAHPDVRKWVEDNTEALELFRQGSECNRALYLQPREYRIDLQLPVVQEMRSLSRIALLEVRRRETAKDSAGMWELYKVVLRASRHPGMHGGIIERLVGVAMHSMAALHHSAGQPIHAWTHHAIAVGLGRRAGELQIDVPLSVNLKTEFLSLENTLADPQLLLEIDDSFEWLGTRNRAYGLFVMGEPDLSQRILKLAFANLLTQCDLPASQRAPFAPGKLGLFELHSSLPATSHDYLPSEIEMWGSSSILAWR